MALAPVGRLSDAPGWDALQTDAHRRLPAADAAYVSGIRAALRAHGFSPSGRNKPASEYLVRAAADGRLRSLGAAVDVLNAASLASGVPISGLDADRAVGTLRFGVAPAGAQVVFNATGQSIDLGGLPCLFDDEGPIANAVKDGQRTKISAATTRIVYVLWGLRDAPARTAAVAAWVSSTLTALGCAVTEG